MGQSITVFVPQQVLALLQQKEKYWLTGRQTLGYSVKYSHVLLQTTIAPNPATLLPTTETGSFAT